MVAIAYQCLLLKKSIENYMQRMVTKYLVSLEAAALQTSNKRGEVATNYLQVAKERTFHFHSIVERYSFCPKIHSTVTLQLQAYS